MVNLPEETVSGYLETLTSMNVSFRAALHVTPLNKRQERTAIRATLRQRHGVIVGQERQGLLPDEEQVEARDEARDLLQEMAASDLRTVRMALFIAVRAPSERALGPLTATVIAALGDGGVDLVDDCHGWQERAWQATLPLGVNPAGLERRVTSPNLGDTFPLHTAHAGTADGGLLGFAHPGRKPVLLNIHERRLDNNSGIVIGKGGTGKTQAVQRAMGHHVLAGGRGAVFDHSTGHWDDLALTHGGQVYRLGLDTGYRVDP